MALTVLGNDSLKLLFSETTPIRNFPTDTPTDEQVKANKGDECNIPKTDLEAVCAHEMGHAFGLDDAYYDFKFKTDRCAENDETTVCFNKGDYDNLMKDHIRMKRAKPNDIEMMLYAYNITKGFLDRIF